MTEIIPSRKNRSIDLSDDHYDNPRPKQVWEIHDPVDWDFGDDEDIPVENDPDDYTNVD